MNLAFGSDREREVVGLWAACDALNDLVNHSLLEFLGTSEATQVMFPTMAHWDLFVARLADFLEAVALDGTPGSSLDVLLSVKSSGAFNREGEAEFLINPAERLRDWLDTEVAVEMWLPTLDKGFNLVSSRREWIRLCGNASKHNPLRLTRAAKTLRDTLKKNGMEVSVPDALRALPMYRERFQNDVLSYHASTIVELLNDVRWGIHYYLNDEFFESKSEEPGDPPPVRYRYPEFVTDDFARHCYWDLMNQVLRGPFVSKFVGSPYLKGRY